MKKRYPGRDYVQSDSAAAARRYEQMLPQGRKEFPCTSPIERHGIGLPDPLVGRGKPVPVTVQARCRRCDGCLAHRRRLWTARAIDEVKAAPRTWFGTLTISPDYRFRLGLAADLLVRSDESSEQVAERFRVIVGMLNRDITKMFKRLRKQGAAFRYLIVAEAHQDGFPHFHLLLHEKGEPIRKVHLDAIWRKGFSQWRLVEGERSAVYVCKYLAKSALTRVRTSQHYGQATLVASLTERVQRARSLFPAPPLPKEERGEKEGKPAVRAKEGNRGEKVDPLS